MQLSLQAIPPIPATLYVPAIAPIISQTHAQVMPHTLTMDEEQPACPSFEKIKHQCIQCNNHPHTQRCKEAAPLCAAMLMGSCCIMLCATTSPFMCIKCAKCTGFFIP